MHITFHSYSLSLFFLQIKPFYTDTFYLHKLMEITPKTWEIEYIRIKRLDQGREKAYVTATDAICCYYKPFPMYES